MKVAHAIHLTMDAAKMEKQLHRVQKKKAISRAKTDHTKGQEGHRAGGGFPPWRIRTGLWGLAPARGCKLKHKQACLSASDFSLLAQALAFLFQQRRNARVLPRPPLSL